MYLLQPGYILSANKYSPLFQFHLCISDTDLVSNDLVVYALKNSDGIVEEASEEELMDVATLEDLKAI